MKDPNLAIIKRSCSTTAGDYRYNQAGSRLNPNHIALRRFVHSFLDR
jgi:hypothetical protein